MDEIYAFKSAKDRHRAAPLLKEREQYLRHLLDEGVDRKSVRYRAAYLIHAVRLLGLTELRAVEFCELEQAGIRWTADASPLWFSRFCPKSPVTFTTVAKKWLEFHGVLVGGNQRRKPRERSVECFAESLAERGMSSETVRRYSHRIALFQSWMTNRSRSLDLVTLADVDEFLSSRRSMGHTLGTIASTCQALRTFFRYRESLGLCTPGTARSITSPSIPKYRRGHNGPSWRDVRLLLTSKTGNQQTDLRNRALFSLAAIYGLRSKEIAGLTLNDFDWRNEIMTVRRAKRGRTQQFPIQYEVGEAILRYLQSARPHCGCRNLFVTRSRPHRAVSSTTIGAFVRRRMEALGIESEQFGPHALRHACATQLLKKGSSLPEIADFLGHRDARSVSIYARNDRRLLSKVSFSLRWTR